MPCSTGSGSGTARAAAVFQYFQSMCIQLLPVHCAANNPAVIEKYVHLYPVCQFKTS